MKLQQFMHDTNPTLEVALSHTSCLGNLRLPALTDHLPLLLSISSDPLSLLGTCR